ncbi:two-component sensor histidine kinase [Aquibacillus halophilus]|uniref:histidine kinase n=1 Tax=Aquibacillus halophilus TaxID=930132 RepID=A0A6A8DCP5_9BACI|nr:ATP-binding protein [Aquibacillus halophilus]MRH43428.1 two-component sensor histidine kinase [Aquibacillus halophilus]
MGKQNTIHNLFEAEEIKALKLFLTFFYLFLFSVDFLYYYAFPYYGSVEQAGLPSGGLGFWFYSIFIPILFLSLYLVKKRGNVLSIKYIYLFSYLIIDFTNLCLIYSETKNTFHSGNAAELVFILFSPLFINKKFFWLALTGIITKYAAIGLIFQFEEVFLPIGLSSLLSILSYILLTRFQSNLKAQLKVNNELRQSEQLAIVGQLATSITHEVRNPLTSLKGLTQLQKEKHPQDSEYYNIMMNELERINSILDDLMAIGVPKKMTYEKNNIQELIEYVGSIIDHNGMEQKVTVNRDIEEDLPEIECNSQQIKQVLINIFKNGMEAMPEGGNLVIKAESWKDNTIKITVTDEGNGISKENHELLGTPFHTTKSDGTGLGLMVSFKIIEEHHGQILYDSEEGQGTTVTILLPVEQNNR